MNFMASSEKTENLKLNLWKGTDKPEREDFNNDNLALDKAVSLVRELVERKAGGNGSGNFLVGEYVGDGFLSKTIDLGFVPRFVFVFCEGEPFLSFNDATSDSAAKSGILLEGKGSLGIAQEEHGFKVICAPSAAPTGATPLLNLKAKKYVYIVIK
ncbi:hypothetical protein FACS1894198_6670 [Clostridia bacterium]|nr:hypothetical protein FACS1894198_6670 [Clostridia bacterium]